jgi:hypothetical protein
MCFNSFASIIAFSIGFMCSSYLFIKKYFFYSIFCFTIIFIQLIEYFAHKSLTNNNKKLNIISAKSVGILIFLQPIIYSFLLIYIPPNNITFLNPCRKNIFYLLLIPFIILSIIYYNYANKNNLFKIEYLHNECSNKNICRLNWTFLNFKHNIPIILVFFYLFFFINFYFKYKNTHLKLIQITTYINSLIPLLFFISFLYLIFKDRITKLNTLLSSFGSIWCFLAVFYPLFLSIIIFNNTPI